MPDTRDRHDRGPDREHEANVHHDNPLVAHEPSDVNVRAITKWGIGLGIFTIAAAFLVWFVFEQLVGYEARQSPQASPLVDVRREKLPPAPRLQPSPRMDVREMTETESDYLNSYAWTDPERGMTRIPVDQAMSLILKKGFSVRPQPADEATAGQRNLPSDSSSGRTYERRAQ